MEPLSVDLAPFFLFAITYGLKSSLVFDLNATDERLFLKTRVKHNEISNINLIGIFISIYLY